jgi:serine/threonine protein kinase
MPSNPKVLDLLEEMLDSGKTAEEVCCDCPELLQEVRRRWQEFCAVDAHVRTWLPGLATRPDTGVTAPPISETPQIPGYEVEGVLGRGGMGVVYKARHLVLKRIVAVKMLAAGHPHPVERARFRAEAEAVARLQHGNIVQIHEVGEADGRPFFAMEYVAGGSLAERLAGQCLPARDAAHLVATLAQAMHLAHSRNLVHRDLKPANVLLAPNPKIETRHPKEIQKPKEANPKSAHGAVSDLAPSSFEIVSDFGFRISDFTPKVSDFGLVRQLDADSGQTCDGVVIGTPNYMAPEQAEGRAGTVGPAADVYALGAILYECLTGRPPFAGKTPLETLEQVRSYAPAAPASLNRQTPRDLDTICLKCLRKQPEQRYSSARELADDLGRFVRGEPVAARPVGRLERVAKWTRRNPTVAGLSAVAALAIAVGTVLSLLFGIEASRKADALEQQAIQLQAQTRAAEANARLAEENEKARTQALVAGLLVPIGRNPHLLTDPLEAAEMDAVRQLRATPAPVRLQFLETALGDPQTARRIGRRADWVAHAIVGCDRALRAEVARLVVRLIQEPGAAQDVRFACARLGLALDLADRPWAEQAAAALLVTLHEPLIERTDLRMAHDDYPALAAALVGICERLPPTQPTDCMARALDLFFTRLREPKSQAFAYQQLVQAIAVLGPGLDTATATRAAETLGAIMRRPDAQIRWPSLAPALAAVCRRLPASDADGHINRTVDFILDTCETTKDWSKGALPAQALRALCGRVDAARASRVAGVSIAMAGYSRMVGETKAENISFGYMVAPLTLVAEHLDAPRALEAAENLVEVLRNSGNIVPSREELRAALVALCRRLDAAGAARVEEAMSAAARDPKTAVLVRTVFTEAQAALADRLTPDQAAAHERVLFDALLANLADTKSVQFRGFVGQALATTCGRPGATDPARAAEGLGVAIRDRETPLMALRPLAAGLAVVTGRLPPKEAASHAQQAVGVLDALWVARTAPPDRAPVAEALAAVWTRLDATDASSRAKRAAADLEDALRDSRTAPYELYRLAEALTAVYNQLDAAERSERASAIADVLVAVLCKPVDDPWKIVYHSQALAALFAQLDRASTVRVTDAVFAVLGGPNVQQFRFEHHEKLFKEIAACLDDRDLRRLLDHPLGVDRVQRVLLDSLARSKHRSFRNTWEYLDATESNGTSHQSASSTMR